MTDTMDYVQMFNLKPDELSLSILVCSKEKECSQSNVLKMEYVTSSLLPNLPYPDQSFNLVLCPNVLFTNNNNGTSNHDSNNPDPNNNGSETFHLAALMELVRVGGEVRVMPLVDQAGKPSKYLGMVIQRLQEKGFGIELKQVQAASGMGINAMLRLWNPACLVKEDPKDKNITNRVLGS